AEQLLEPVHSCLTLGPVRAKAGASIQTALPRRQCGEVRVLEQRPLAAAAARAGLGACRWTALHVGLRLWASGCAAAERLRVEAAVGELDVETLSRRNLRDRA